MRLLIVRHAIAEEREDWSGPDSQRPLTDKGRERMKLQAAGLRKVIDSIDCIYTSPYSRALSTAEILSDTYKLEAEVLGCLAPGGNLEELAGKLRQYKQGQTLVVTGHEPGLSQLASLCTGHERLFTWLKKGSAFSIMFQSGFSWGSGELEYYLPPKILRRL